MYMSQRQEAFRENVHFLGVNKKKGDIVFLVLYDYKAIRSLGIYSCYSFIPLSLLSQSCLDLLYSPLINCLQLSIVSRPSLALVTREISDHRSTTLPTGRQVKCPLGCLHSLALWCLSNSRLAPDKTGSEVPGATARSAEQRSAHPWLPTIIIIMS